MPLVKTPALPQINWHSTGVRDLFADNFSDQADATGANDTFDSGSDGWSNGRTDSSGSWGQFSQQWPLHHG